MDIIKLNNNGFLLYDALLSLILLSSTILFFNKIILINQQITIQTNERMEMIEYLRQQVYDDYNVDDNGVYQTYFIEEQYCVKQKDTADSFCIDV